MRHNTAWTLGGEPTGELERAARRIAGSSNAEAAELAFGSPLLARAFGDVTIRPGPGKKFLTIPISGPAYGLTVANFERKHGSLIALFGGNETRGVLAQKEKGRKVATAHYLLTPEAHQKQDASLLPPDEQYLDASVQAAITFLESQTEGRP